MSTLVDCRLSVRYKNFLLINSRLITGIMLVCKYIDVYLNRGDSEERDKIENEP